MMIDDLVLRWNTLKTTNGESVHQEYDTVHPLRIFFGLDGKGNYEFIIRIDDIPSRIPTPSQSIYVEVRVDASGQLLLCFELLQANQKAVFMHLFWDLAEAARDVISNTAAVNKILLRYGKWQRLMEHGNRGILSMSEIKGLLGELLYLEEMILSRHSHTAVTGWMGPEGADRDFEFQDCWYEVKTLDPAATLVGISSIEQLDTIVQGELILMFVENTSPEALGAITLNFQVERVRKMLHNDYGAQLTYEEKLVSAGYIERNEYDDIYFLQRGKRRFKVNDIFPVLRRSSINGCISKAQYHLGIAGLSHWEII